MFPSLEWISLRLGGKNPTTFFKGCSARQKTSDFGSSCRSDTHSSILPSSLRFFRVVLEKCPSHFGLQITTALWLGCLFSFLARCIMVLYIYFLGQKFLHMGSVHTCSSSVNCIVPCSHNPTLLISFSLKKKCLIVSGQTTELCLWIPFSFTFGFWSWQLSEVKIWNYISILAQWVVCWNHSVFAQVWWVLWEVK